MFGLFRKRMTAEQSEQLLLIAQAVKSGLPLSNAIRLTVTEEHRKNRPFLRLATLLDEGVVPQTAVKQAGFSREIKDLFAGALDNSSFIDAFALQSSLAQTRYQTLLRVIDNIAYPLWLLFAGGVILYLILAIVVPNFGGLFRDFDANLPPITIAIVQLGEAAANGGLLVMAFFFLFFLFLLSKTIAPRLWYSVPILGAIYRRQFQNTLLRTIAFSMKTGMPLADILTNCENLTGNRAIKSDLRGVAAEAKRGVSIIEIVIHYPWLFPVWLAPMLVSCQGLEEQAIAFEHVASTLNAKTHYSLLLLQSSALACSLIAIVFFTGIIVISLFLPMFKLVTSLSS